MAVTDWYVFATAIAINVYFAAEVIIAIVMDCFLSAVIASTVVYDAVGAVLVDEIVTDCYLLLLPSHQTST